MSSPVSKPILRPVPAASRPASLLRPEASPTRPPSTCPTRLEIHPKPSHLIQLPNFHQAHPKFLKKVFRFLIAIFVGATIWLLKILVVKVLASSFHVATFFDRMKESVFHHYILDALSGPPVDDEDQVEETRLRRLKATRSMPARVRERKQGRGRCRNPETHPDHP